MSDSLGAGAVIFAKDLARVARFYEGVLGMQRLHAAVGHIVLESPQVQLVIHGIPARIAAGIQINQPPERRSDTAIKLFFPVASLSEARAKAAALGGQLDAADKEWTARGFRACDGHDPEGNVLQLRERA